MESGLSISNFILKSRRWEKWDQNSSPSSGKHTRGIDNPEIFVEFPEIFAENLYSWMVFHFWPTREIRNSTRRKAETQSYGENRRKYGENWRKYGENWRKYGENLGVDTFAARAWNPNLKNTTCWTHCYRIATRFDHASSISTWTKNMDCNFCGSAPDFWGKELRLW